MAEHAVEHVDEDAENLVVLRHVHGQTLQARRHLRVLVENRRLLGDVLHDRAHRHVAVEHQNQVLAMRHEHQMVRIEAVHQWSQEGVHVTTHPGPRCQPGTADQLG